MVPKKAKSKRQTCAKRYKIEKKIKEKHRKDRRGERKASKGGRPKKDPGIPSNWPYKEQLLNEIEGAQMAKETERDQNRLQALQKRAEMSMAAMARDADRRGQAFELANAHQNGTHDGVREWKESALSTKDNSRRAYYKEFRKVVNSADVLLQVLDARDPLGSRARHVEKFITEHTTDKRIVLVLNKVDLVPKEVCEQWLKYLRREFPTVPFKSSTQTQRSNLGQSQIKIKNVTDDMSGISECLGADVLVGLLKNYARNHGVKRTLRVGVVGYPNVGKSSVINSLKRSRVCQVGSRPGVTKTVAEVALDKSLRLLDCPGIVFDQENRGDTNAEGSASGLGVLLRNCIKAELIDDPVAPVEAIVQRCDAEQLMLMYTLPRFSNSNEFLVALAQKRGKLRKGGVPDIVAAARTVLEDWNTGKIPFYTLPPATPSNVKIGHAELIQTWSTEFSLSDVIGKDGEVLDSGSSKRNGRAAMVVQTQSDEMDIDRDALKGLVDAGVESDDEMEDDSDGEEAPELMDMDEVAATPAATQVRLGKVKPIGGSRPAPANGAESKNGAVDVMTTEEAAVNFQANQKRKTALKQARKKQQKMTNKLLSATSSSGMDVDGEDYDFGEFYSKGGLPGMS